MFFFFFFPGTTTCVRENLSTRTSFKKMIIKLLIHNDNKISKRWNYFGWKHDLWRHIYFFVFYELIMFEIVIQMCYFLESISPKNLLICLHYHSKTALSFQIFFLKNHGLVWTTLSWPSHIITIRRSMSKLIAPVNYSSKQLFDGRACLIANLFQVHAKSWRAIASVIY